MNDAPPKCSCIIDCSGLHELASSKSDNLKSHCLNYLKNGTIAVPACVWKEFQELYNDEALALADCVTTKIKMKKSYYVGAAGITEGLNSGFSRGPYDSHTDLYTASIASIENYRVLTTQSQLKDYKSMGCNALELAVWIEELDTA